MNESKDFCAGENFIVGVDNYAHAKRGTQGVVIGTYSKQPICIVKFPGLEAHVEMSCSDMEKIPAETIDTPDGLDAMAPWDFDCKCGTKIRGVNHHTYYCVCGRKIMRMKAQKALARVKRNQSHDIEIEQTKLANEALKSLLSIGAKVRLKDFPSNQNEHCDKIGKIGEIIDLPEPNTLTQHHYKIKLGDDANSYFWWPVFAVENVLDTFRVETLSLGGVRGGDEVVLCDYYRNEKSVLVGRSAKVVEIGDVNAWVETRPGNKYFWPKAALGIKVTRYFRSEEEAGSIMSSDLMIGEDLILCDFNGNDHPECVGYIGCIVGGSKTHFSLILKRYGNYIRWPRYALVKRIEKVDRSSTPSDAKIDNLLRPLEPENPKPKFKPGDMVRYTGGIDSLRGKNLEVLTCVTDISPDGLSTNYYFTSHNSRLSINECQLEKAPKKWAYEETVTQDWGACACCGGRHPLDSGGICLTCFEPPVPEKEIIRIRELKEMAERENKTRWYS